MVCYAFLKQRNGREDGYHNEQTNACLLACLLAYPMPGWAMSSSPENNFKAECEARFTEEEPYEYIQGVIVKYKFHPPMPCGFPPNDPEKKAAYKCEKRNYGYDISLQISSGSKLVIYISSPELLDAKNAKQLIKNKIYSVCAYEKPKESRYRKTLTHIGDINTLERID